MNKNESDALREFGRATLQTFAAAYLAVTVAYSPILVLGYWDRNVLSLGENAMSAGIATVIYLIADRVRQGFLVHLVAAVILAGIMLVGMITLWPRDSWIYWIPMFGYIGLAWWLVHPIREALRNSPTESA